MFNITKHHTQGLEGISYRISADVAYKFTFTDTGKLTRVVRMVKTKENDGGSSNVIEPWTEIEIEDVPEPIQHHVRETLATAASKASEGSYTLVESS